MSTRFESTLRSLEREGQVGFGLMPVLGLIGAWGAWLVGGDWGAYALESPFREP